MAKSEKRKIGDLGEGIACNYLKNKGFNIIEQNYWKPWGEIDIIAEKQGITHFVEVKTTQTQINAGINKVLCENTDEKCLSAGRQVTRGTLLHQGFEGQAQNMAKNIENDVTHGTSGGVTRVTDSYNPADNIHPWKLKRLSKVIQTYILSHNIESEWEFSAIIVYLDIKDKTAKINHIKDIVL